MCSFAVQIVYGILGLAVLGLTITSLALDGNVNRYSPLTVYSIPAWTKVSDSAHSGLFCTAEQIAEALQDHTKSLLDICHFDFSKFTVI